MTEHYLHQTANDWAMCHCGKVFGDSKTTTAIQKLEKHIEKER